MSKIIDIKKKQIKVDSETIKLKVLSDRIDEAIIQAVTSNVDPILIAAVVLNRFIEAGIAAEVVTGQEVIEKLLTNLYDQYSVKD